jgi:hypothetical protein
MTNSAPAATYRILGTTDEVTSCEHCGRVELKGTIVLGIVDADGNIEDRAYFGATCGAKAAGRKVKEIREEAAAADRATNVARYAPFAAWVRETYGLAVQVPGDLGATYPRRVTGKTPREVVAEFEAAVA